MRLTLFFRKPLTNFVRDRIRKAVALRPLWPPPPDKVLTKDGTHVLSPAEVVREAHVANVAPATHGGASLFFARLNGCSVGHEQVEMVYREAPNSEHDGYRSANGHQKL